jgi:hypothetical protein
VRPRQPISHVPLIEATPTPPAPAGPGSGLPRCTRARRAVLVPCCVLIVLGLSSCRALLERRASDAATGTPARQASPIAATAAAGTSGGIAVLVPGTVPGAGVVTGRLVDAVSGLPVPDAGVSLLGRERRTIAGTDGRFRLDGVEAGAVTVVLGPIADYVPRSVDARMTADGLDLGITPLLPASPPTLIVPEYGGIAVGCTDTRLVFSTEALSAPAPVRVTCLTNEREFPAPPPAGRLPLAAVDLSPGDLQPGATTRLSAALPAQPRYGEGVALDLLRLDLDRLIWIPTSTLTVDPGGRTASGAVSALGTYMIVAPPFGTFVTASGTTPQVQQFRLAAAPDGAPADVFPTGSVIVYAVFDYVNMDNTTVTLLTTDALGTVAFESARPFTGRGRENVPMVASDRVWRSGDYLTTLYVGDPPTAVHSVAWRVTSVPTPIAPTPTLPAVPPTGPVTASGRAVPVPPPSAACRAPLGWFAYVVRPGDTIYALARRTGTDAETLRRANCLSGDSLAAGAVIYIPSPPSRPVAPTWPTTAPPPPAWPTTAWPTPVPWPTPGPVPTEPPVAYPTTWYTPPVPTVAPPEMPTWAPPKPTAPEATVAPLPPEPPTAVPPVPDPPTDVPLGPRSEPTAPASPKWPTIAPVPGG